MPPAARTHLLVFAAGIGATLAALVLGAGLVAWSGLYSVAASRGHWFFVEWFLTFAMQESVETHALLVDPPPLHDPDLVRLGAGHFHSGCAFCHGAPGLPVNPIPHNMLPPPPDLTKAAPHWKPQELFWIVKNGLKYTGMPAWPSQQREDEVWAVIAFLLRMPELEPQEYRRLALGEARTPEQSGREVATVEGMQDAVTACARCHGAETEGPASRYVPVLHGQSSPYLLAAMQAYATGRRGSGIMQPVASDLPEDATRRVVEYYAHLPAPAPARERPEPDAALAEEGARLAAEGDSQAGVPPCLPCHGGTGLPVYPRLAGQSAAYIQGQLKLWKEGFSRGTLTGEIMGPIARRMSERQMQAASAYFESLPPGRKN